MNTYSYGERSASIQAARPPALRTTHTVSDVSLFVSPFWRGAQPKDHCSPETQALPRSTRETPARRPRLAAGRTTASLGDRSCWGGERPPAECTLFHLPSQGHDLYLGFSLISLICTLVLQNDLNLGFSNLCQRKNFIMKNQGTGQGNQ